MDTRHKNADWQLREKGNADQSGVTTYSYDTIQTAILMDIRDEPQTLNRLLGCSNFVDIPRKLDAIKRSTAKTARLLTPKP